MIPINTRNMINEEVMTAPSKNQLFVPRIAEMGASVGSGLNHRVRGCFNQEGSSVVAAPGSFSLVT